MTCIRLLVVLFLLLLLLLITLALVAEEVPPGGLLLLDHLGLCVAVLADLVGGAGRTLDVAGDLTTTNQRGNDGAADDEGEDETVHAVPGRGQTALGSPGVGVVHVVEDQELRDERSLNRHENGGRCGGSSEHTNVVTLVSNVTTVAGELKSPVDGTGEGNNL
jgi:hypothetical protein